MGLTSDELRLCTKDAIDRAFGLTRFEKMAMKAKVDRFYDSYTFRTPFSRSA